MASSTLALTVCSVSGLLITGRTRTPCEPSVDDDGGAARGVFATGLVRGRTATGTAAATELRAKRVSLRDGCERPFEDEIVGEAAVGTEKRAAAEEGPVARRCVSGRSVDRALPLIG